MASTSGAGLSLAKNWDFQMTIDMRPGRMLQQCYNNVITMLAGGVYANGHSREIDYHANPRVNGPTERKPPP
ncbi:hypothetical protein TM48_03852 [Mycobacterium shottsii]|nr:hypothetical protein TM48_03852 [Mycobacterium shottsii]